MSQSTSRWREVVLTYSFRSGSRGDFSFVRHFLFLLPGKQINALHLA